MNAFYTIPRITACTTKAKTALAEFLATIPAGAQLISKQSGSRKNQTIRFFLAGEAEPFFIHHIRTAGWFRPLTSIQLKQMAANLATRLETPNA